MSVIYSTAGKKILTTVLNNESQKKPKSRFYKKNRAVNNAFSIKEPTFAVLSP